MMILDIWISFKSLPCWVQLWVFVLLVPVNMASLFFWPHHNGVLIAVLANGAMVLNGGILFYERGFSRAMALPHVVIWTPLVVLVAVLLIRGEGEGIFATYLWLLLVIDSVSLVFDIKDAGDWWRGKREVAGR